MCEDLNRRGVPSPNGKKWVYQTLIEVLQNYRYSGRLTLGKDKAGKHARLQDGVPTENKQDKMRTGAKDFLLSKQLHEAIVPIEQFDFVQTKLATKKSMTPQRRSYKEGGYALTGIVFCGCCRKPLYGTERKGDGHNRAHKAYYCKGKSDNPNQSGCPQWRVEEEDILPLVIREAAKLIEKQLMIVRDALAAAPATGSEEIKQKKLTKQRRSYETAMKRFLKLEDDALASELERELKRMKAEIEAIERELELAKVTGDKGDMANVLRRVENAATNLVSFWTCSPDFKTAKDHLVRTADLRESLQRAGLQVFVYFEEVEKRVFGKPRYIVNKITMSLPDLVETVLPSMAYSGLFQDQYGYKPMGAVAESGNNTSEIV